MSDIYVGLLGNGFDLNHKLPTKYINFLHTVQYLVNNYTEADDYVGKIFGAEELQKADYDIRDSYNQFSKVYDVIRLPKDRINELIKEAKSNLWYKYFEQSLNKELNWIDFEKEIALVINTLSRLINEHETYFYLRTKMWSNSERYIINNFPLFFEETNQAGMMGYGNRYEIKKKYLLEYPYGSKVQIVDTSKIIADLYTELRKLSDMLKTYLVCFVDGLTIKLREMGYNPKSKWFSQFLEVYTFNYTDTYENLYGRKLEIDHIHGSTKGNIVLGINPDEHDELAELNTSFIQFKKYYQRVFFGTDNDYLFNVKRLREQCGAQRKIILHVVGHSLDITDKDIIQEVFDISKRIIIYYHHEDEVGRYIKNLIQIYGKANFDKIRNEKELVFLPLGSVEWERKE